MRILWAREHLAAKGRGKKRKSWQVRRSIGFYWSNEVKWARKKLKQSVHRHIAHVFVPGFRAKRRGGGGAQESGCEKKNHFIILRFSTEEMPKGRQMLDCPTRSNRSKP